MNGTENQRSGRRCHEALIRMGTIRFCLVGTVEAGNICTTRTETATIIAANAVRKSTGVKRKMTELERCALLGDRKAQEECTRQGILLPCPLCGNTNIRTSNWGMWRCWCPECRAKSDDCLRERDAIKQWNTRPALPIGRCKDCANACPGTYGPVCVIHGCNTDDDAWCNDFEKKEG